MSTEFTPGPWEVDYLADPEVMAEECVRGDWVAVADTAPNGGHVAYCHPVNAQVIAAAPDMLEALEACHGQLVLLEGKSAYEEPFLLRLIAAARAAIVKAKGGYK